jgi:hypothetical protein
MRDKLISTCWSNIVESVSASGTAEPHKLVLPPAALLQALCQAKRYKRADLLRVCW